MARVTATTVRSRRRTGFKSRAPTYTLRLRRQNASTSSVIRRKQKNHKGDRVIRTSFGFPDNFETTLSYSSSFTLTTAATGTAVIKSFNMNGLYDPDPAIGGLQPYWFDQFMAAYDRYAVLGSKAAVTFLVAAPATTTLGVGPWSVGVYGDRNTTSLSTNPEILIETQNGTSDEISGDYKKVICTTTYSPKTCLGKSSWDDAVTGTDAANPTYSWYANVWATELGSVSATSIQCIIKMDYRVRFSSIKDNAGS